MSWSALLLTGLALAMDAFAVCVSSSVVHRGVPWRRMLRLPVVFALFQAGMPALGWAGTQAFRDAITAFDHWIAFALLAGIGAHMLIEARGGVGDGSPLRRDPLRTPVLLALALATSIDALAAGVGLAVLDVPIGVACAWIGGTTFVACVPGVVVGRRLGARLAHRAEALGGLVLIGLGVRILVQHLAA
ncbi:MAG: manganese efflux pump [Planctomycetes bacterium]|nr:manganese efflux pump [Planctomycetota bacterium]